jgi:hypothetical protein
LEVVVTGGTLAPKKFDAPSFVSVEKRSTYYEVKWKPVPGAAEYLMFAEDQYAKQMTRISPVIITGGNLNGLIMNIDFADFDSALGKFKTNDYRFAIAAVNYEGLVSDLVFSNVIPR